MFKEYIVLFDKYSENNQILNIVKRKKNKVIEI